MTRFTSFFFCLLMSTAAAAGGGERDGYEYGDTATIDRDVDTSPSTDASTDTMEVEFIGSGKPSGLAETYDVAVDGDLYQIEVEMSATRLKVRLFDEAGDLIVGHIADPRGAAIFDDEGLVASGRRGKISLEQLDDYGPEAALLANPTFLAQLLEANGDTLGDDPPALAWWVYPAAALLARCLEVTISGDLDGVTSWSVGWDC